MKNTLRSIILIWLAWCFIIIGFQAFTAARFTPRRPDFSLLWTPSETRTGAMNDRPYLMEPFMNNQVSWDSEYYLSIAVNGGYDDSQVPSDPTSGISLNYAFFPLYPILMRLLSYPLMVFGQNPIATATLAGVIISALGTLAAMISLYLLGREELGEEGGLRAAFYMLIFPSGFFLAQVYTEGLFVGLAFTCLVLIKNKRFFWASLLATAATLTRAVGLALVLPLGLAWLEEARKNGFSLHPFPWRMILKGIAALLPVGVYLAWSGSDWGTSFKIVEENFFSRQLFAFEQSWYQWKEAFLTFFTDNSQGSAYFLVEFFAIGLGIAVCILAARRYPTLALFSALVFFVSLTSGVAQGMHRYVLGMPVLFLVLSRWGKNQVFDRGWTLASTLVMGIMAAMYTYDFWAG